MLENQSAQQRPEDPGLPETPGLNWLCATTGASGRPHNDIRRSLPKEIFEGQYQQYPQFGGFMMRLRNFSAEDLLTTTKGRLGIWGSAWRTRSRLLGQNHCARFWWYGSL
jgi:hypothetical protein